MYKGTIREKPSGKEEAREYIKGFHHWFHNLVFPYYYYLALMVTCQWVAGYSGSHGAVVSSVLISNLKTGKRKGGWDRAEVLLQTFKAFSTDEWPLSQYENMILMIKVKSTNRINFFFTYYVKIPFLIISKFNIKIVHILTFKRSIKWVKMYFLFVQVYFYEIPDEVIDSLVKFVFSRFYFLLLLHELIPFPVYKLSQHHLCWPVLRLKRESLSRLLGVWCWNTH